MRSFPRRQRKEWRERKYQRKVKGSDNRNANIWVIGIPGGEISAVRKEQLFEEIVEIHFPEKNKSLMDSKTKGGTREKPTSRHSAVKVKTTKHKENILRAPISNEQLTYRGTSL